MERRPWILVFIAVFNLIAPFVNVLGSYFSSQVPFKIFLQAVLVPANIIPFAFIFIPSFIAAYAIWVSKKWSYFVFLCCMLVLVVRNGYLYFIGQNISFTDFLIASFINTFLVSYFLIPNVRKIYFNPRLRWWETKTRYSKNVNIILNINNESVGTSFSDISEGGIFIVSPQNIALNSVVPISFIDEGISFELQGEVVYKRPDDSGYGIKFVNVSSAQKKKIKQYIHILNKNNVPSAREIRPWQEDLFGWLRDLKQFKGLLPKLPGQQ